MAYLYRNVKQSILEENQINRKGETVKENLSNCVESVQYLLVWIQCVHISRAEIEFCLNQKQQHGLHFSQQL